MCRGATIPRGHRRSVLMPHSNVAASGGLITVKSHMRFQIADVRSTFKAIQTCHLLPAGGIAQQGEGGSLTSQRLDVARAPVACNP